MRLDRSARFTRRVSLAGALAMVAALAACSEDPPDPQPAAQAMADALATGDFSAAPLASIPPADVAAEVDTAVEGMDGAARSVTVADVVAVEDEENVWTVTFDLSWDLSDGGPGSGDGGEAGDGPDGNDAATSASPDDAGAGADDASGTGTWSYTTTARLTRDEGEQEEQWGLEWSPALLHPDLQAGDRLRVRREQAERAEILGADGTALVTEREVHRFGIDKTRFDDGASEQAMSDSARELAELTGVDAESLAERVLAAGERAFVEAITYRTDDAAQYLGGVDDIEGARAIADTMQLAPTREFARPILGTVGSATAEIVEESGGRIQAGDVVGLSGLQQQYDQRLGGAPGVIVELVPSEGEPSVVFETEPVPGEPLTITLDAGRQMRAEELLADVEPAGALVAIRPSSGDVVAAASGPGGDGYSTAMLGQYAPGSTFKVATALALLRSGLTPESAVECPETLTVDGREYGNYSGYPDSALGEIPLATAVAESCNTAMMGQRDQASQQQLAEAAGALGLGVDGDLGFPAYLGSVPREAEGTAHAAAMIGQGEVLASPLGMATVAASVAAGETVVPRLLEDAGEPGASDGGNGDAEQEGDAGDDGDTADEGNDGAGDAAGPSSLTGDEAHQLQAMMRAAVDGGSASSLADVPGDPVGAKTGTAEYGTEDPPRTHAWMIAFQGDLAVAVFVEDGESGSQTAGPLLEAFLTG